MRNIPSFIPSFRCLSSLLSSLLSFDGVSDRRPSAPAPAVTVGLVILIKVNLGFPSQTSRRAEGRNNGGKAQARSCCCPSMPHSSFSLFIARPSFLPSFWCNYSNLAEIKWLGGGGGLGLRPGRQWHALASLAF